MSRYDFNDFGNELSATMVSLLALIFVLTIVVMVVAIPLALIAAVWIGGSLLVGDEEQGELLDLDELIGLSHNGHDSYDSYESGNGYDGFESLLAEGVILGEDATGDWSFN